MDAGYFVATAINGERALKRVQAYPPDLILLDVQMPGIDGFETCKRLKAEPKTASIPIIFMTSEFLDGTSPRIYPWNQSKIENRKSSSPRIYPWGQSKI
jgi:CheY-like chemotaxis protein